MSHIKRFDHVGLTVADLDIVTAFFVALGLEVEGRTFVEGEFTGTFVRYPAWVLRALGPQLDVGTSWSYEPVPTLEAVALDEALARLSQFRALPPNWDGQGGDALDPHTIERAEEFLLDAAERLGPAAGARIRPFASCRLAISADRRTSPFNTLSMVAAMRLARRSSSYSSNSRCSRNVSIANPSRVVEI